MDLLLSPAVESAQSLNYWTAREAPIYRDIYHGIFLKQRKGHNLNPQIGDWIKKLCFILELVAILFSRGLLNIK